MKEEMVEVAAVTTGTLKSAKLQSNHHQSKNIQFLQVVCPSYHQPTVSKLRKAGFFLRLFLK